MQSLLCMSNGRNGAQVVKGLLDALVLLVLSEGDSYGFAIYQEVTGRMGQDAKMFQEASLYPLLHRLEEKRFVEAYWMPGDRGTDRKYYRITEDGTAHLADRVEDWNRVARILNRTIFKPKGGRR